MKKNCINMDIYNIYIFLVKIPVEKVSIYEDGNDYKVFRHVGNLFIQGFLFIHPWLVFIVQPKAHVQ